MRWRGVSHVEFAVLDTASSCSRAMSRSPTRRGSIRSTGPATTPSSSTIRSTASTGSWRGCRKYRRPGMSGRSTERCGYSPKPGRTWRTPWRESRGRREGLCRASRPKSGEGHPHRAVTRLDCRAGDAHRAVAQPRLRMAGAHRTVTGGSDIGVFDPQLRKRRRGRMGGTRGECCGEGRTAQQRRPDHRLLRAECVHVCLIPFLEASRRFASPVR